MDQNHDHLIEIAPSDPDELPNDYYDNTDEAGFDEAAEILNLYGEIEGTNSHIDHLQISTWLQNWLLALNQNAQKLIILKINANYGKEKKDREKNDETKIERQAGEICKIFLDQTWSWPSPQYFDDQNFSRLRFDRFFLEIRLRITCSKSTQIPLVVISCESTLNIFNRIRNDLTLNFC